MDEAYADCIEKINNLIKLKISTQNGDGSLNEFIDGQLTPLLKEKKTLMEQKGNIDERIEKWLELSTKTFNFVCYARMRFYKWSLAEKKEILQTIGSNFILEGKTLRLQVPKPFLLVEEAKNEISEIRATLEPQEKVDLTSQMLELFAQNLTLRCILKIARTEFCPRRTERGSEWAGGQTRLRREN